MSLFIHLISLQVTCHFHGLDQSNLPRSQRAQALQEGKIEPSRFGWKREAWKNRYRDGFKLKTELLRFSIKLSSLKRIEKKPKKLDFELEKPFRLQIKFFFRFKAKLFKVQNQANFEFC